MGCFAQFDLEHGHNSAEFEVIKAFFKWFVLVNNCDVSDMVNLMETFNTMLDEFSEFHGAVNSVGNTLDDDFRFTVGFEQVVGAF
jgi:hypothetical protein